MADDIPSRSHMMMMSRSDLQGVRREPRVARAGNQFYGALIPMFLAHDHHDEKDPYLVDPELKLRGTLVELHSVLTKSTIKSQTGTCIGMMRFTGCV